MKLIHTLNLSLLFIIIVSGHRLNAQTTASPDPAKLKETIFHLDSIFWASYNTCNVDKMQAFFTDDLEFYHDKGGLTTTSAKMIEMTKNNLCGNNTWRLRREVVRGSLKIYPLNNYGAILTGEHVFYVLEKGKKDRLDGLAKFTHVWQFKNNEWKMSRVLSYDHQPAPFNIMKEVAHLSDKTLMQYAGKYEGTQNKNIILTKRDTILEFQASGNKANLYPESENKFFLKERDVQFEFVKDNKNKVQKMLVRENGQIVEEAKKIN